MDTLGMGLLISLKDAFTQNASRIQNSAFSLDAGMSKVAQNITRSTNQITGGLKMMGGGLAALAAPAALITSTLETQRALGALSAEGVQDLRALEDAATRFTNQWAGYTKPQFLNSAWEIKGALSQLSDQAVGTATAMTALTAKATRADLAGMTEAVTSGYAIFKALNKELSDQQWFESFSGGMTEVVNKFRTDGNKMALALRNLGNAGSALQVPVAEQMATLGTLMTDLGGEQAGTFYRALLNSVVRGGRELGIAVTETNGRMLSMTQILRNLQNRFGDLSSARVQDRIKEAFGSDEAKMALLSLLKYSGQLPDSIAGVGAAFAAGSAVTEKAAALADRNIAGLLGVLKNRSINAMEAAGNAVGVWAAPFVKLASDSALATGKFIRNNQTLVGGLLAVPSAFGAALVAAGALRFGIGGLTYSLTALRVGIATTQKAWASFSLMATLSNPVVWAIAGVAASLAGMTLLWKTNFAGVRDITHEAAGKLALLLKGIREYRKELETGKPMDVQLSAKLDNAGLSGPSAALAGVSYRLREAFKSLSDTLAPQLRDSFRRASDSAGGFGSRMDGLLAMVLGVNQASKEASMRGAGPGMADGWRQLGKVIGTVAGVGSQVLGFIFDRWTQIGGAVATVIAYGNRATLGIMRGAANWLLKLWNGVSAAVGWFRQLSEFGGRALMPLQRFTQEFYRLVKGVGLGIGEILGGRGLISGLKEIGGAIWTYLCSPFQWIADSVRNTLSLLSKIPGLGSLAPVEMPAAPPMPQQVAKGAAAVVKQSAPGLTQVPKVSLWKAPALGRATAAATIALAPLVGATPATASAPVAQGAPVSNSAASFRPISVWPRPEPVHGAGTASGKDAVISELLAEIRQMRRDFQAAANRPLDARVVVDGREVAKAVQDQNRLQARRSYE